MWDLVCRSFVSNKKQMATLGRDISSYLFYNLGDNNIKISGIESLVAHNNWQNLESFWVLEFY